MSKRDWFIVDVGTIVGCVGAAFGRFDIGAFAFGSTILFIIRRHAENKQVKKENKNA